MESGDKETTIAVINRTPVKRMFWRRMAAAAVIGLVLLSGAYFLLLKKNGAEVLPNNEPALSIKDIAPGGDRALLTLADGTTIILDSATDGSLAQQGGVKVIKLGGQLAYHQDNNTYNSSQCGIMRVLDIGNNLLNLHGSFATYNSSQLRINSALYSIPAKNATDERYYDNK